MENKKEQRQYTVEEKVNYYQLRGRTLSMDLQIEGLSPLTKNLIMKELEYVNNRLLALADDQNNEREEQQWPHTSIVQKAKQNRR